MRIEEIVVPRKLAVLMTCLAVLMAFGQSEDLQPAELRRYFGFGEMQMYKLKDGASLLHLADLDGDGRTDIVVWNRESSRLELFYQPRDGDAENKPDPKPLDRNELADQGDLVRRTVPVGQNVVSLVVGCFNGDEHADLVCFTEAKRLLVFAGGPDRDFAAPQSYRADGIEARGGNIALADFNSDGRADVALIGERTLLLFSQRAEGGFGKPDSISHGILKPMLMLSGDLDGDGRADLVGSADDDEYGAFVLLQDSQGGLGAVRRAATEKLRSVTVAPRKGGDDVLSVEWNSGRLKQFHWAVPTRDSTQTDWPQLLYSFAAPGESKRRAVAVGDVTLDGLDDVLIADPDGGQVVLFEQAGEQLRRGVPFPSLLNTLDLCVADYDGDGRNEIISVSPKEKMIGTSQFEHGRVSFPAPIEPGDSPLSATFGSLQAGAPADTLVSLRRREKGSVLQVARRGAEPRVITAGELKDDPDGLLLADVNQDGLNDILLFVRFSPLRAFLQSPDGGFEELTGAASRSELVKEASLSDAAIADINADGHAELLLAQKSLARALRVENGAWTVVEQFNPETPDAQVRGVAVVAGPNGPRVVLLDRKARDLLVFERRGDGAYAVARSLRVGSFESPRLAPLSVGGGKTALLLSDLDRMLVIYPDQPAATLVEERSYETAIKDAWLADAVVGDMNHDGVRDIAVVDMRKANIEILTQMPDGDLARVMQFQVFQGKRFSAEPDAGGEPHEALCGDVTGDGTDDLVVLVHDRLIVYPGQ